MGLPVWLVVSVGFLSLVASFVLQLLVSLGPPFINEIYFLHINFNNNQKLTFGIWAQCVAGIGAAAKCTQTGLGYQQSEFQNAIQQFFVNKLPYAFIVQPVATGFTFLAACLALLHLCTNPFVGPLSALWASFLTMSALVIELVVFILARDKIQNYKSSTSIGSDGMFPTSTDFGPALWMQVAALPACFFGFLMLTIAWWMKRCKAVHYDDYQAPNVWEKDDYYNYRGSRAPSRQSRRSRYDNHPNEYEEPHAIRDSQRSSLRNHQLDHRNDRRTSYVVGEPCYLEPVDFPPPTAAPNRNSRSRRFSERGAY